MVKRLFFLMIAIVLADIRPLQAEIPPLAEQDALGRVSPPVNAQTVDDRHVDDDVETQLEDKIRHHVQFLSSLIVSVGCGLSWANGCWVLKDETPFDSSCIITHTMTIVGLGVWLGAVVPPMWRKLSNVMRHDLWAFHDIMEDVVGQNWLGR